MTGSEQREAARQFICYGREDPVVALLRLG